MPWQPAGPRITAVETVVTAPDGVNLVLVRVRTSDDGLVGWGCATFTQRAHLVAAAVETYLAPLLVGRSVHDIADIAATGRLDSYWRGGPVLNSALAGVDLALWDIKGKVAGMPVWQLLGGRVRTAAECYVHASGRDVPELLDQVEEAIAAGYRSIRCQVTVPGTATYGAALHDESDASWDPEAYVRMLPAVLEEVTHAVGGRARLLHDIHERVSPPDALRLLRALEPLDPLFLEDAVAPEDVDWLPRLRQATTVPLAYGELIVDPRDAVGLVTGRLVDYLRCHVSAIGGLTPAWRLAGVAELHGVRTAWHGPRDVSPVGHAANLAMDLASPAFGIHEHFEFSAETLEVFPGTPVAVDGALAPSETPGLGVDVDPVAADRHPPVPPMTNWHYSRVRRRDGASQRP